MEAQIRTNARNLLRNYCNLEIKNIETEEGIVAYTIKMANKRNIVCCWDNRDFTDIYYDKLRATIDILACARKLEFH